MASRVELQLRHLVRMAKKYEEDGDDSGLQTAMRRMKAEKADYDDDDENECDECMSWPVVGEKVKVNKGAKGSFEKK